MGILVNSAYILMAEAKRKPFHGRVLQLGRQSVLFPYAALINLAAHLDYKLTDIGLNKNELNDRMTDKEFFLSLGFSNVLSMEFGTQENADYIWDLNNLVPEEFHEKFDFIYDGGTVEHIFHIPNCLYSICSMLKIDGRVCHDNGVSGTIDHGFYQIQPTLYYDFYLAQKFKPNMFNVSKLNLSTWLTHTGIQIPYTPGMYDYNKTWAVDGENIFITTCFATKTEEFHEMKIPQQSIWSRG